MTIRNATPEDVDLLMSLVERLESELPQNPHDEDPAEVERAKVERMVADARREGFRIRPVCPFVVTLFKRHPDWADVHA